MEKSHEALVGDQFGSRADAYLKSAVHAQSPASSISVAAVVTSLSMSRPWSRRSWHMIFHWKCWTWSRAPRANAGWRT